MIRKYLLDEGLLREKIKKPHLDFGFQFVFPKGVDPSSGRQKGRPFMVTKPKNKDFIEISSPIVIDKKQVEILQKEDKKKYFFSKLQKYLLNRNFYFQLDGKNNRYVIIDNIFLSNTGTVSKNVFFKSIRKIFTSTIYTIIILNEICSNIADLEDWEFKG